MSRKDGQSTGENQTTRRAFIRHAAASAATVTVASTSSAALGANERIGIGLIGCGGRGNAHLGYLEKLKAQGEKVEVTAVCDVYKPRMDKAADKCKAKGYLTHEQLLTDPNVDAVCIASPDHIHGQQVLDAVKAKKDVYCEKPITHWRQLDLTRKLAVEVPKSGRVFQLGTQGMSDGAWYQIKSLIKKGMIGKPIHAECGYFRVGDWGERGMPIDDPKAKPDASLNWEAFLGDAPKCPFDVSRFFRWRMYEDYSGGPVTDLFPHSLTPVVSMLGVKSPKVVVATGGKFRYQEREVPDTFNMIIDYPENISVVVLGTQGNGHPGTANRGAGGRIPVIRGWEGTLTVIGNDVVFSPLKSGKGQRLAIKYGENQHQFWKDFLNCCRARKTDTLSPMDLAYSVQTALQMAVLAFHNGKTARFDPENEKIVI